MAAALTGSDELLSDEGGGPLALSFFSNAVGGVVHDVGIIGLESAAHAVEADASGEQALVRRIGGDQTRRASGVGTRGDGVQNGDNGFAKTNHVVVCGQAGDGGSVFPRCLEEEDAVQGGRHDGDRKLAGRF